MANSFDQTSEERVRMKVKVYRNGDPVTHPTKYSYDSNRVNSFKQLLDQIQNLKLFDDGFTRITRLYTIDGRRIVDQYSFETSDLNEFVASGPEGFMRIKGGYQNHVANRTATETPTTPTTDEHHPQDPNHSDQSPQPPQPVVYREENAQHEGVLQRPRSNRPIKPRAMSNEFNTYDRVSYLSLNKQRSTIGGASNYNVPRDWGDRIENRNDMGTVKRIYLYRNGDPFFKPKLYVYRSKVHKKWDKMLEDVEKLAPPIRGGGARHLYTLRGREVTAFEQLSDKRGYVVSGADGFLEIRGGYELIGRAGVRAPAAVPEVSRKASDPATWISDSGSDLRTISRPRTSTRLRRPKTGRPEGESVLDRQLPEPTFFFVFKNGDGLEAKRFVFTPQQMDKGMSWLMEQIGRRFGIYAHKLVTMDNREITDARQFINRGAYIVIPFGAKFTENWHHFPEMAIDTGVFNQRDLSRSQSRSQSRAQSRYGGRPRTSQPRSQSRLTRSQSVVIAPSSFPISYGSVGEPYSEEERLRKQQHHDQYHPDGYRERMGSAASHCSICDLIEQHRTQQIEIRHSADDVSRGQMFLGDNPQGGSQRNHHLYSAEDIHSILPPRPVTSRRIRLSPPEMPDDPGYPVRSSSMSRINLPPQEQAQTIIDDHGPVVMSRRGSLSSSHVDLLRRGSTSNGDTALRRASVSDYQMHDPNAPPQPEPLILPSLTQHSSNLNEDALAPRPIASSSMDGLPSLPSLTRIRGGLVAQNETQFVSY